MIDIFKKPIILVSSLIAFAGSIASILTLEGWLKIIVIGVLSIFSTSIFFYFLGRNHRKNREEVLDELGIYRVYSTATEDDDYFSEHVSTARKIRILSVNMEMLLRNLPSPFKIALKNGALVEVLIAKKDSELVNEMEQMEISDGRGPGRSIPKCIEETKSELISTLLLKPCNKKQENFLNSLLT